MLSKKNFWSVSSVATIFSSNCFGKSFIYLMYFFDVGRILFWIGVIWWLEFCDMFWSQVCAMMVFLNVNSKFYEAFGWNIDSMCFYVLIQNGLNITFIFWKLVEASANIDDYMTGWYCCTWVWCCYTVGSKYFLLFLEIMLDCSVMLKNFKFLIKISG